MERTLAPRPATGAHRGGEEHYLDVPFFRTYQFGKRYDYLGHAEQWDEMEAAHEPGA